MMKRYSIFALASGIALSLFASCSKDNHVPAPAAEKITITASFPEEGLTKVGFVEDGYNNKLNLVWQDGDQIVITDEANPSNTQTFDIVSGAGTASATFTGTAPAAAASYRITYGGNPSYAVQTQAADGDTGHLKYVATLTGVTDYTSFTFTDAASSAVLRLRTQIPAGFYGNVKSVVIKAGTAFVKVDIADSADAGETNVFTVYASLPGEMAIAAGTELYVSFMMDETKAYLKHTAYRVLPAMTIEAGKVNTINLNCSAIETSAGAVDNGTAAKPYLIADQQQMDAMHTLLAAGEKKYFKMVDDVDMTGVAWAPLNPASPYDKETDFNGDGHTISNFSCNASSYPSFFGVLYGKCHDVKFVDAAITAASKGCGILGGYGGTAGKPCVVENVHVQGTVTSTVGNCVGGMFGTGREAVISNSSADVIISSVGQQVGGIIGTDAGLGVTITNCWTAGSVSTTASIAGGICGDLLAEGSSILNCYSTASVTTQFIFGGIVGRACAGQKTNATNCNGQEPQNHIENCIAWNDFLKSDFVTDTAEHYSSGAVIGGTAVKNYLKNCWRKSDLSFTDCPKNAELGTYVLVDQEDADPEHPMVKGAGTYAFAYHGKAAAAGKTLSQVAQEIGWSADVWDFSAVLPTLK